MHAFPCLLLPLIYQPFFPLSFASHPDVPDDNLSSHDLTFFFSCLCMFSVLVNHEIQIFTEIKLLKKNDAYSKYAGGVLVYVNVSQRK